MADTIPRSGALEPLPGVVIRFAGDSGDGMQLTGDRFTTSSALFGNDLATQPDYPAEIRAPAGTVNGVSAFQVHISDHEISTPGDAPDVLVAMNPAALRAELAKLRPGGTVIVNIDSFDERNIKKAGYAENPLDDDVLKGFTVHQVPMTSLTREAVKDLGVKPRDAERSKNLFALGLISWMYTRPVEPTLEWLRSRFAKSPQVLAANEAAFKAGHAFGETAELFDHAFEVKPAPLESGTYTNITGNTALAWGLVAAGQLSGLPVFLGSYPITPASDILHELSKHKNFGVRTFQAEDEIAGVASAIGAAFGGHLGVTTTSGPGLALKGEALGLAISLELPVVVVDIQRGGPSTGLPTKTEAADLLQALYGRHGEAPVPVLAAKSPAHCFEVAIEAARIALTYRTPVILLSDGYLANGAEPWKLPDVDALAPIDPKFATGPNHVDDEGNDEYWPYLRDPETLARDWAIPGTPGLMHRIGGIEKEDGSGNISYEPANHERMVHVRRDKIQGITRDIPPTEVEGDADADLLVLGWGSTWGAIGAAVDTVRAEGHKVARAHITHLNPLPADLGDILRRYRKVLVPEMNLGQLTKVVRAEYLVDATCISKVQGQPFTGAELASAVLTALAALEVQP
ncbi:MAG: 2-oxoacid:acceptor oxidoreductase subunit alpha [Actinomycetia bacterium]|nr:2-oxoacid:acceptor oxidoreductase subunit alpha [Actinomycetes bacterium]